MQQNGEGRRAIGALNFSTRSDAALCERAAQMADKYGQSAPDASVDEAKPEQEPKAKRALITSLTNIGDDDILLMKDVAAILGDTSVESASEYVRTGKIRGGFRYGKKPMIYARDLKQWIEEQKFGIIKMERMGFSPEMISWHLPRTQRAAYLRAVDAGRGEPEPIPADLPAYKKRMDKLVAAGYLREAEAHILTELKANGIALKGRPKPGPDKAERGKLRSV